MNTINKYDVIKSFLDYNYKDLLSGKDIPPLKFIFANDFFCLAKKIDYYKAEYIIKNNMIVDDEIAVNISNFNLFFSKLTELCNLYIKLDNKYDYSSSKDFVLRYYISSLWLKMTPYDFYDIYGFLDRNISFLKNHDYFSDDFNFLEHHLLGDYLGYEIDYVVDNNSIWYETYTHIEFELVDKINKTSYKLPAIHFGIADNNNKKVCYIYDIQNIFIDYKEQDKKIGRSLYKLNNGIENPLIHPSFVLAMKLFIDVLKEYGIYDIKVFLLEVLNYGYHEILSKKEEIKFKTEWNTEYLSTILDDKLELEEYEKDKKWHDRIVGKEDFISKSKVENLAYLMLRISEQFDNINIETLPYCMDISIKKEKKLERK